MTPFQRAVADVVLSVPPGEVVTYGEVAAEAGYPGASQAVANVLRAVDGLPWWRVISAHGRLYCSLEPRQRPLLEAEGVVVDDRRRVRRALWDTVKGRVVRGHGVASGGAGDPRYPDGTIRLQVPAFRRLGLDLSRFHPATLNVSVAPGHVDVVAPLRTLRAVDWSPHAPAEDFSFFSCRVRRSGEEPRAGLVYRPHPETKPEHHQPPGVLEILTAYLADLAEGDAVEVDLDPRQLRVSRTAPAATGQGDKRSTAQPSEVRR